MRILRIMTGIWMVPLLWGCAQRVVIPQAPTGKDPLEKRRAYYESHHVEGLEITTSYIQSDDRRRVPSRVVRELTGVTLKNGVKVEDPRDLSPMVLPNSRTAAAIACYEQKTSVRAVAEVASYASLVPLAFGIYTATTKDPFLTAEQNAIVQQSGGIVIASSVATFLLSRFIANHTAGQIDGCADKAFDNLNTDLRVRLRLRKDGSEIGGPPTRNVFTDLSTELLTAQPSPFFHLEYDAPGCASVEDFTALLSRQAPEWKVQDASQSAIKVAVRVVRGQEAGPFTANIELVDAQGHVVQRQLEGDQCTDVVEGASVVAGVFLSNAGKGLAR